MNVTTNTAVAGAAVSLQAARRRAHARSRKAQASHAPESLPASDAASLATQKPNEPGIDFSALGVSPEEGAILLGKIRGIRAEALETLQRFRLQESQMGAREIHYGDEADRANAVFIQLNESELLTRAKRRLQEADDAIRRMHDGSFGWCEETGDPIGYRRLMANPLARYCLEAQERIEVKNKLRAA